MKKTRDESEFWDRVEHQMKMQQPGTWRVTLWLLRLGMSVVLFSVTYVVFFYFLKPANGFFVSRLEMAVHPIVWVVVGVSFIIGGAYLRFRAIGPIADTLKDSRFD